MTPKMIKVDERTHARLAELAAEHGTTIGGYVGELACAQRTHTEWEALGQQTQDYLREHFGFDLTPQERAVVTHLATGKGNAGIAEAMFIGEHTVEWHLRSVYGKLGVRSRQEVISAMFRQVLLPGIEQDVLGQG